MKRKYLLGALIISIVCTACSSRPTEIQYISTEEEENINNVTDENDSDAEIAAETEKYSVYQVKEKDFSLELLEELFLEGRTVEQKRESPSFDFDDFTDTFYECSDGSGLTLVGARVYFSTKESNNYPIQYFYDDDMRSKVFQNDISSIFPEKDLDFMTLENAKALVSDYLNRLDIETGEDWETYPLDAEKLTEVVKGYYTDEEYEQDIADGYKPVKRDYDKEDEVYLFRIPISVDGNVITFKNYEAGELNYTVYGSSVEVIVGDTGIIYFTVINDYEPVNVEEKEAIISEDDAIQAIKEEYAHLLAMNIDNIKSYGLYYVSTVTEQAKRDGFKILPAYIIAVTRSVNDEKEKWTEEYIEIVNAISGEII